jgi:hypothetical protein
LNISAPDPGEVTGAGAFLIVLVVSCAMTTPALKNKDAASNTALGIFTPTIVSLRFFVRLEPSKESFQDSFVFPARQITGNHWIRNSFRGLFCFAVKDVLKSSCEWRTLKGM